MRKLSIIIGFMSVSIFASDNRFLGQSSDGIFSAFENENVKDGILNETYIKSYNEEETIFTFFDNTINTANQNDDDPGDIPVEVSINLYQIGLLFVGIGLIIIKGIYYKLKDIVV